LILEFRAVQDRKWCAVHEVHQDGNSHVGV
jgi:hypothetical protein